MRKLTIPILSLFLILSGCKPQVKNETPESKPLNVKVRAVQMLEYKIPVRATGLLSTSTEMKLSFKTGGIISQLHVREGESVQKGDVLARLDLSEIRAHVNQARIGLEKAERDLARAGNLYRDSVATLEQYQNAESAFELAKSRKNVADFNLRYSQIKAPSEGQVQKILVEANEVIAPGFPAILFASTENDWVVRASLTDKDIVKLALGDTCRVYMDAFPEVVFTGEISELGSVADPVTGTFEAELLLLQTRPEFRTGFISRVEVYPAKLSRSLVVPIEALLDASDNSAYLFTLEKGAAVRKRVRIGAILDGQVVVLDGISEGELVVTDGAKYLTSGEIVNAVNLKDQDHP
jgi:RND family efflux transporter MFP subunit